MRLLMCCSSVLFLLTAGLLADEPAGLHPEEVFQQLDKNHDGFLNAAEIPSAQQRFFARLVRLADDDQDGRLNEDEFIAGHEPDDGPGLPVTGLGGSGGRRPGNPQQRFQMLDRNKDGKVSRSEVPQFAKDRLEPLFERLGKDELTLEDFQRGQPSEPDKERSAPERLFAQLDTNEDGKLSSDDQPAGDGKSQLRQILRRLAKDSSVGLTKAEFLKAYSQKPDVEITPAAKQPNRPPTQPFFQRLDKNQDGKLSRGEVPARLKQNFDRLDKDRNGFLTPDELPARQPD